MRGIAAARRPSATATPTSTRPTSSRNIVIVPPSDLDVHDALDRERPEDHEREREREHETSGAGVVERLHVTGVDGRDQPEQDDRQGGDDPARKPSLCGERVD